ncbi:class I SAM-dependent methyltransferase [Actinopolymorpha sp. B11F2]|uniref:class I SAM-dependent methyltransferase n=1 Tax=Actinopolymorpha sp. B11F2 TaxID=3160862 RepID=UPI0032E38CA3
MATARDPAGVPGWLLDEIATAGRENLDADHVARYDLKEDSGAAEEVLLCRELGLTRESTIVEIGPGTGQFTLAVAPECRRIVAVDVSPVMLRILRAKIDETGLDNIDSVRAGFLTYDHQGSPADFVYSRYSLHHLPDFWKAVALARIHRFLRPGGVFRLWDIVYSFEPTETEERIEAWCSTLPEAVEDGWNRRDLEEHVRDEHSTFSWLLEPMMRRAGFAVENADYSDDGIFAKYVLRRT